ncbi:LADA_0G01596g1_1 [Lachancea dasiensis]|uniref:LADA_0G01596g1_1 n=1 Tax=Lachancea dasiensis TaxID=1072105 RepID=A0A1G4JQT9_9SACH|nr:LADA_0G01596g1_1 [Lachancea dasiensis]
MNIEHLQEDFSKLLLIQTTSLSRNLKVLACCAEIGESHYLRNTQPLNLHCRIKPSNSPRVDSTSVIMPNLIPVMSKANGVGGVRTTLSENDALNLSLGSLGLPTGTSGGTTGHEGASSHVQGPHNATKLNSASRNTVVGAPTLVDILEATDTPSNLGSNTSSHPTVESHVTPLGNDRASAYTGAATISNSATRNTNSSNSPAHFGIVPQVASGPGLVSGASNSTTSSVQLCQRMDEVSARMIAMEEMFNKLCSKITDQETTIQHLRLQSERFLTSILSEVRQVNHSIPVLENPDDNEKDGFVTDLLNSITNVSSNYLKKVNSKNTQKYKRQRSSLSESDGGASKHESNRSEAAPPHTQLAQQPQTKLAYQTHQAQKSQQQSSVAASLGTSIPQPLQAQLFKLNPNGIKRRRANTTSNNDLTGSLDANQTFSPLGGVGSMSLPNMTLEKGALSGRSGLQPSVLEAGNSSFKARPRSIDIRVGSERSIETDSSDDDEDGYQEDDEGHNTEESDSHSFRREYAHGSANETHQINYDTEYSNFLEPVSQGMTRSSSHKTLRQLPISKSQNRNTHRTSLGTGKVRHSSSTRDRDLDYTLLKAPANVRAIWKEYTEGIDGNPSVKFLEEAYGNKWRVKKNVKTFARRKRLYKFIINGMKRGHTSDEMIDLLEKRRVYRNEQGEVKKRTIGWLQQSLSGI